MEAKSLEELLKKIIGLIHCQILAGPGAASENTQDTGINTPYIRNINEDKHASLSTLDGGENARLA